MERISRTETPSSRAASTSTRFRRTRTSPASAASGCRSSGWRPSRPSSTVPSAPSQIAAAAEVHAQEEGIVVAYSEETAGSELVEQARAALSADELARATELGRRLTIEEALDLARPARVTAA